MLRVVRRVCDEYECCYVVVFCCVGVFYLGVEGFVEFEECVVW